MDWGMNERSMKHNKFSTYRDLNLYFFMKLRRFLCKCKITVKFKSGNCVEVNRHGLEGGLVMLWTLNVTINMKSYSRHHIDLVVHMKAIGYM